MVEPGETWDSLKPHGVTGPVETVSLKGIDAADLASLSEKRRLFLDESQMLALAENCRTGMGRDLTDAELEMFAQTWSDHCFHTTWKSLGLLSMLSGRHTGDSHPLVLSSFEDNAGVMEFYDGWALTVKGETHNSPTAVSPYGGIMTKHGGVIRDTLGCGQGAWPIGGSTVMGLGDPRMPWRRCAQRSPASEDHPAEGHTRHGRLRQSHGHSHDVSAVPVPSGIYGQVFRPRPFHRPHPARPRRQGEPENRRPRRADRRPYRKGRAPRRHGQFLFHDRQDRRGRRGPCPDRPSHRGAEVHGGHTRSARRRLPSGLDGPRRGRPFVSRGGNGFGYGHLDQSGLDSPQDRGHEAVGNLDFGKPGTDAALRAA